MLNVNGKKFLPEEKLPSRKTRATRTSEPEKVRIPSVATFRALLLLAIIPNCFRLGERSKNPDMIERKHV